MNIQDVRIDTIHLPHSDFYGAKLTHRPTKIAIKVNNYKTKQEQDDAMTKLAKLVEAKK